MSLKKLYPSSNVEQGRLRVVWSCEGIGVRIRVQVQVHADQQLLIECKEVEEAWIRSRDWLAGARTNSKHRWKPRSVTHETIVTWRRRERLETVDLDERELGDQIRRRKCGRTSTWRHYLSEDKRREQSYIVRRDGEGGSGGNPWIDATTAMEEWRLDGAQ